MGWMLALVMASGSVAVAQDRPMWGGIGHVTQGFMLGDVTGIGDELDKLGDGAGPGAALVLGGGGRMLLGGRALLGGGGHGRFGIPAEGQTYSVMSYGGGGQFDLGFLLYNQRRMWVYPFAGVAFGGVDTVVANHADAIASVGNQQLEPGARTEFGGGYGVAEIGAGVTRLFFDQETQGGMVLDLQMAVWLPASSGSLGAGLTGAPSGMLFRINAGGGGFSYGS